MRKENRGRGLPGGGLPGGGLPGGSKVGDRFFQVHGDGKQVGEAEQSEEFAFRFPQIEQYQVTAAPSQPSLKSREGPDRRAGQRVQRRTVQDQSEVSGRHHGVAALPERLDVHGIDPAAETEDRAAGHRAAVDLERETTLPDIRTCCRLLGPKLRIVARHGHESIATAPASGQFRESRWRGRKGRYWNLIAFASTVRRSPGCTPASRLARSMTLRNSRTLPGQWCSLSLAIARGVRRSSGGRK